mmetsp:Transcript_30562/g.95000  ORF Transcript_30562/g.95000 Transcript_30562/m.95000 type:complete len:350 (-) Transcript_30562:57-1106(-)
MSFPEDQGADALGCGARGFAGRSRAQMHRCRMRRRLLRAGAGIPPRLLRPPPGLSPADDTDGGMLIFFVHAGSFLTEYSFRCVIDPIIDLRAWWPVLAAPMLMLANGVLDDPCPSAAQGVQMLVIVPPSAPCGLAAGAIRAVTDTFPVIPPSRLRALPPVDWETVDRILDDAATAGVANFLVPSFLPSARPGLLPREEIGTLACSPVPSVRSKIVKGMVISTKLKRTIGFRRKKRVPLLPSALGSGSSSRTAPSGSCEGGGAGGGSPKKSTPEGELRTEPGEGPWLIPPRVHQAFRRVVLANGRRCGENQDDYVDRIIDEAYDSIPDIEQCDGVALSLALQRLAPWLEA